MIREQMAPEKIPMREHEHMIAGPPGKNPEYLIRQSSKGEVMTAFVIAQR
jgi:hypothetical protein